MSGVSASKDLIAMLVRDRARSSSTCPNKTSVMITAAASKYSGAMPAILNACGKNWGNSSATKLNKYAAAVPMPIRLNILRWPVLKDATARSKNGQPAHSTTGVARPNCSQLKMFMPKTSCRCIPGSISAMVINKSGKLSTTLNLKRRVISLSSLVSSSALASLGSKAMPHLGQVPGPTCSTSGCIGQVKMLSLATTFGAGRLLGSR